jgi:hypothetical protein
MQKNLIGEVSGVLFAPMLNQWTSIDNSIAFVHCERTTSPKELPFWTHVLEVDSDRNITRRSVFVREEHMTFIIDATEIIRGKEVQPSQFRHLVATVFEQVPV